MSTNSKRGNKNTFNKSRIGGPNRSKGRGINGPNNSKGSKDKTIKDTKGYWAYSFFQKIGKGGLSINEQVIKTRLYNSKFNPFNIQQQVQDLELKLQ